VKITVFFSFFFLQSIEQTHVDTLRLSGDDDDDEKEKA
jgi:hypothetical protein